MLEKFDLFTLQMNDAQKKQFMTDFMADFDKLKAKPQSREEPLNRSKVDIAPRPNKHSALAEEDVVLLENRAEQLTMSTPIRSRDLKLWYTIQTANNLAQKIISCDLPSDNESDAALVKVTHVFADELLQRRDKSWLRKILEIALFAKNTNFGNCQEKAFFGFACLLLAAQKSDINLSSLRLAFFDNHFILVVNQRFLMDPWLNIAFPLDPENPDNTLYKVFEGFGELVNYFAIDTKRNRCVSHQVVEDSVSQRDYSSENELQMCLNFLKQHETHFDLPDNNPKKSKREEREAKESYDSADSFQSTQIVNKRKKPDDISNENQLPSSATFAQKAPGSPLFFADKVATADIENTNDRQPGNPNVHY